MSKDYFDYNEFDKIKIRSSCGGDGDCDNCDCSSICSAARTAHDEYGGNDE